MLWKTSRHLSFSFLVAHKANLLISFRNNYVSFSSQMYKTELRPPLWHNKPISLVTLFLYFTTHLFVERDGNLHVIITYTYIFRSLWWPTVVMNVDKWERWPSSWFLVGRLYPWLYPIRQGMFSPIPWSNWKAPMIASSQLKLESSFLQDWDNLTVENTTVEGVVYSLLVYHRKTLSMTSSQLNLLGTPVLNKLFLIFAPYHKWPLHCCAFNTQCTHFTCSYLVIACNLNLS